MKEWATVEEAKQALLDLHTVADAMRPEDLAMVATPLARLHEVLCRFHAELSEYVPSQDSAGVIRRIRGKAVPDGQ